jgi:NitT/TauT family transport system ATP-binding protein
MKPALSPPGVSPVAPSIEIKNLTLGHTVADKLIPALGPLSLNITSGETVALVGPSGCGKTSLLMALIGELTPVSGGLEIDGGAHRDLVTSMVFQQNTVFPWLTALENVRYPLRVNGAPPEQSLETANRWLKRVGMKESANKYPAELSGGMLQRVAIARALANEPKLLFLDEPFGQLDELTRMELGVLLAELLSRFEITTILVTHSLEEAVFIADTVVVISNSPGKIISKVPIRFKEPRTQEILNNLSFHEYMRSIRASLLADRKTRR